MKKFARGISADDFEVGQKMMLSRSRRKPVVDGQVRIDFMLQGAVIEIKALNLPYILGAAFCPMRGQTNLVLDIRDHEFIRVTSEFAEAVVAAARPEPDTESDAIAENEVVF